MEKAEEIRIPAAARVINPTGVAPRRGTADFADGADVPDGTGLVSTTQDGETSCPASHRLLAAGLAPGILEGDGAVEDRALGGVVAVVADEVADALELE